MKYYSLLVLPDEGELAKVLPIVRLAITTLDDVEMESDISNAFTYKSEAETPTKHLMEVTNLIRSIVSESGLKGYHYTVMTNGESPYKVFVNIR